MLGRCKEALIKTTPTPFLCFILCCSLISCESAHVAREKRAASSANVKLGLAYLNEGLQQEAKKKLLAALEKDPKNSAAYTAFGYFLEQSGENNDAERYYKKAIAVATSENQGANYNNYGTYLYRQQRYDEAISYFLKAISVQNYTNIAAAYENASLAAKKMGNNKLANAYLQKATQNGRVN